jgi:hypothetical protein
LSYSPIPQRRLRHVTIPFIRRIIACAVGPRAVIYALSKKDPTLLRVRRTARQRAELASVVRSQAVDTYLA